MPMPDTVQEFVSTRLAFCDLDLETNFCSLPRVAARTALAKSPVAKKEKHGLAKPCDRQPFLRKRIARARRPRVDECPLNKPPAFHHFQLRGMYPGSYRSALSAEFLVSDRCLAVEYHEDFNAPFAEYCLSNFEIRLRQR